MNTLVLRIVLALVIAGCLVGIASSRADRAELTIRIAFLASKNDEDYVGSMAFKEAVERLLPGRVDVQVFPSGQFCGSERECMEGMQSGILEIHQTTVGGLAALYGAVQVLDLPYSFRDDAVVECVVDGPLVQAIGDRILADGLGLRLMAVGNTGGWRSFGTTKRRIAAVDDLAGLRIRTLPSALEQQMVRDLGSSPMALPWSEVYGALNAGILDGIKNSAQDIVAMKLDDHIRHLYVDRHSYMAALWWYSEKQWQRLKPEEQDAIREGFRALAAATRKVAIESEQPALAAFERRGGSIDVATPEQRADLRQRTASLRAWYVERYGQNWLDQLDTEITRCEAAHPL
ncbi:MAG: TRAP transporter substrate-binding protein DctP [Xanthomonadales bacterium]|jgi:TRAP-type C4-dicarboxylate transport system substrate-binding protein|nr:TRAP transporter substrate-binding protein DctP [Xanthomonadales bacterium]